MIPFAPPSTRLVRLALLALAAFGALAAGSVRAQAAPEVGSPWELRVEPGDGEGPVRFEVRADPDVVGRSEMQLLLFPRGSDDRRLVPRIVPPAEPGVWLFEVPRSALEGGGRGAWGVNFRHGVGLDLWYGFAWADLDPGAAPSRQVGAFRGGLGDAPSWIQPAGFAVFGVILAGILALIALILARLRRAQPAPA